MASSELYGVKLRSLNRYQLKDLIYEFGRVYMVDKQRREELIGDPNGDYFEDVVVNPEHYDFVRAGKHILAVPNGNRGRRMAPPAVVVPEVQEAPVGFTTEDEPEAEAVSVEEPKPVKKKLKIKPKADKPREIIAGEPSAPADLRDSGEGVALGEEMEVPADLADEPAVEV